MSRDGFNIPGPLFREMSELTGLVHVLRPNTTENTKCDPGGKTSSGPPQAKLGEATSEAGQV